MLDELDALDADGRITEEGNSSARAAAAAAAGAHDRDAAGRCGDARRRHRRHPDRTRARRRRHRSRSRGSIGSAATARRGPQTPAVWRSAGRSRWRRQKGRAGEEIRRSDRRHAGAGLSRPRRAQPRHGSFMLANGRGAASSRPRRWRASPISRSPKSPAPPRRGASCSPRRSTPTRSRRDFADQIEDERRDHVRSRCAGAARPPQADSARDHAVGSTGRAVAIGRDRTAFSPRGWSLPGWTSCRGRKP